MLRLYSLLTILSITAASIFADAQTQKADTFSDSTCIITIADTATPYQPANEKLNKEFIIGGWQDFTYTVSRPAHWQKKDWIKLSAVVGGTGALLLFDKKIKSVFLHNQNTFTNAIADGAEPFGDIYGFCLLPAVYVTGLVAQNEKMQSIGLRGSKALAISTVLFSASKKIIRRSRPDATDNPFDYALPFAKSKFTSTPSGHTTIAFTIATTLAEEFPEKKWVAPVAYSLASLTGLSRIYHNRHWASDVLLGAALGHFATKAVYASSRKRHKMFKTFQ